jgi:hypothetical protein
VTLDWGAIAGTAVDGFEIYQAVERLKAAVSRQLGSREAERGAQAGGAGGRIPYAGTIVKLIDLATAAVENPTITAVGIGAGAILLGAGAWALFKEVRG